MVVGLILRWGVVCIFAFALRMLGWVVKDAAASNRSTVYPSKASEWMNCGVGGNRIVSLNGSVGHGDSDHA